MAATMPDGCTVIAEYADMESARRAIDALQFGGVEAGRIALLGAAAEAARRTEASGDASGRDTPLIWRILWRGFRWRAAGGVAGAVLGVAFAYAGFGMWEGGAVALQIASWAMFGHVAGALWGAYAAISGGEAWQMTFQPVDYDGCVLLGVRADARDAERVARILRDKDAVKVFQQGVA